MKLSEVRKWMPLMQPLTSQSAAQNMSTLRSMGYEPEELYQELEMDSRYVDTHQDITSSNTYVSLHSHTFYELLCCSNSCGAEYLVGAERYRLQKGDIVFIAPGISHRPLLPEAMPVPYIRDVLWLSPEFAELMEGLPGSGFGDLAHTGALLRTAGTRWEFLCELFHTGVVETERQSPGWETAVIGNTISLLTHMSRAFRDRGAVALKAERPELLDRAMAYIEDNLHRKITLADVARQLYVSESTVSQVFRGKMGFSFHQCLTQRRLIAAKSLIQQGTPLETTAHRIGFPDYSTFYRAFKKEYGITPRQYRKILEYPTDSHAGVRTSSE